MIDKILTLLPRKKRQFREKRGRERPVESRMGEPLEKYGVCSRGKMTDRRGWGGKWAWVASKPVS